MMVHDASTSLTIAPSTQTKQITDWNQAGTGFRERLAMYSWKATRGSLNLVLLLQTSVVPSTRELLWVVIHMKVKVLWRWRCASGLVTVTNRAYWKAALVWANKPSTWGVAEHISFITWYLHKSAHDTVQTKSECPIIKVRVTFLVNFVIWFFSSYKSI